MVIAVRIVRVIRILLRVVARVAVFIRRAGEGSAADVAEQRAVGVLGAAVRAFLVFKLTGRVRRVRRNRRRPSLAAFVQICENARTFFFIAASVVRCTADRANDDIVIFRKRLVAHGTLDAFVVQNRTSKIRLAIFERRSEYCQNYFLIHIILQNARNRNAKRANFQTVNNSVRKRSKTSRKANIKISAKPCVFPHFSIYKRRVIYYNKQRFAHI